VKLRLLFLLFLLLLNSLAFAGETLDIGQIQDLALSRSAQLRASAALIQSEKARASASRLYPNPNLLLQLGQADVGGVFGHTFDFTIGQTIPFPTKSETRSRILDLQTKLAEVSDSEARLIVQHSATLAAIRLATLTEISKHSIERRRRLRLIQDYMRSHPQVSPSQRIEAALIDNQMRTLEKGMLELTYEQDVAASELNFFIQLPFTPEVQYQWLSSIKLPERAKLEAGVLSHNLEMRRNSLEFERANESLHFARQELWPDLGLNFNYRLERTLPQNVFYSGGLSIILPLWDRGQHSIPAAQAIADNAFELREHLTARLKIDFDQAWKHLLTSQQQLELFPLKLVKDLDRKFDEAEREFRKGRISTSVFLAMESQIHETMDWIYDTQYELVQNLSHVLLVAGEEIHL
jgi:outer membrane protein TolC